MMNTLWTLFLIVVLGGIVIPLLASAWERTVMRKSSAAAKHRLWTATAVGLFVFPLLAFTPPFSPSFSPRTEGSGAPPPVIPAPIVAPQQPEPISVAIAAPPAPLTVDVPKPHPIEIAQPIRHVETTPQILEPESAIPTFPIAKSSIFHPIKTLIVALWFTGIACFGAAWLYVHGKAATFLLRCQTGQASPLVDEIRQRFRIRRNIRVVYHEKIPVPLAMGIFRPTVFFPLDAANWPDEKVRVVLLHELAHVARRDLLWQNLVRLACIVYWPLPTVWYLAHRVKTEQELACDDMVLQSGQRSSDYAEVLLGLSKNLSGARIPQAGITMVRRKTVSKRIDAILDVKTRRNPVGRLLGLSLLCGVILSTGFVSLFAPKIPLPAFVFSMNKAEQAEEIEEPKSDDNFRLGEERTIPISGRVLLPDGSPAGETWLTAKHVSGWQNLTERLQSDKNGKFRTKAHVGAYFMVLVDSPYPGNDKIEGFASSVVATIVSDPPQPGQYDVPMIDGTKLHGKLAYADGSPAPGKSVTATVYGFGWESMTTNKEKNVTSAATVSIIVVAKADENGNYSIRLAPGVYDIIQADNLSEHRLHKTIIKENEEELRMDFVVPPPTRGVIILPDGSPAANLKISCNSLYGFPDHGKNVSWDLKNTSTDDAGNFEVILSEYENVIDTHTKDGKFGIVKYLEGEERLEPQMLTLQPACVGKVRLISEATGKPVADYPLKANLILRKGRIGIRSIESDSDGVVKLMTIFPEGEYRLDYQAPIDSNGSLLSEQPDLDISFFPKTPGETVDLGEKRIPGDFKAYEPKPNDANLTTITGRIIDEDGEPVVGAVVCGGNESLTLRLDTTTDANGEYRFENWPPSGMAYVGVWCRGKAAQLKTMTVDPKAPPKIDFSLSPAGKPIKVELRDDEGRPVPNFYVTIPDWGPIRYPGSALLWGKADDYPKTDENGTFVWNEAPDLEIPLDFNDADWQNSKYMQIRGEKFIPRMEPYMFLVNPKLEISGKVVDAATGKPIPEFKMFWGYRDNPEYAAITWLSDKIQAGNDGVYSISETWPRYRYYVRIDADGYDPSVSRDIDINEGKQEIDFSLNKMSAENAAKLIRGTVLTPDGKPAAGADVAMLTLGRQPPFFDNGRIRGGEEPFVVKTDDKGAFQFAEVDFEQERRFPRNFSLGKSYDYILCFVHDTGFRRIKQDAMQEILKTGKPITLEKWGRLEGTLEVNATPGAGETVVFSDFQFLDGDRRDNSNPWAGFQYDGVITDARGRFAIERIPAGEGTAYRAFSKKRTGWNASAYTSGTPVMIRPGETTKIQIGGGWPVIGKLEFTAPNIDWSYANLRAYPGKEKPDATQERLKLLDLVPKNLRTVGDDRYAWMREMQKWMETTEDGKKYVRETTRLNDEESRFQKSAQSCLVAGDGTFRLDDMNSGDWLLEVELLAPPSMDRPYDNGKLLAHTQRHFRLLNAVPGGVSDVPFDLGMIRLKDGKGSKFDVGDIITVNADSTVYPDAKIAFPISCEIVSVNEDGTLAIRGEQEMEIGVVRRTVELNGTVRPEDIEPDNTVSGERVRNMTIKSNEEEVNNDRNGDLTATLPNGGTLSLRSLADPTSLENVTFDNPEQNEKMVLIPSWKPNGVTLPDHSFRRTRYSSISDTIRLDLKALKGTYFISYFPGLGGSTGSYEACNVYVSDWKEKDEIDFPVLFFPESETKKARPKENVHYLDDEQECLDNLCEGDNAFYCTKPKKNANKNVVFVQSEGESHAWEVYYAFRPGDWDSEKFQPLALDFAVFDREEREIPARTQGMAIMVKEDSFGNSLFLVNQTFFLKDAQAEPVEVRIERKAYYRVDFQNVSLKPGHLTKPTISVKAYPVEKQEAPQEKTNEALTAKLPNGGTLSLVSLSDPTQRKNDDLTLSWTPSGKMLTDMPFDAKRHDWSKSLLLLDLEAEKGRIAEICERGTYVVTSDGVYGLNLWDLDKLDEMDFLYLYFPDQEPKKPVPKENVHYLDNEEECLEHPFENYDTIYCTRLKRNAEKDTEFLKGEGKCEAWDISFPFRPEDLKSEKFQPVAWDFVLLDREGREIPPVSSYGPEIYVKKDALGNEIRLWNETFLLKVGQAESVEVRIERKPYYRVDFHNVSLKPGHLTKPTISVKAYPVD